MKKLLYSTLSVFLLFVACSKEEQAPPPPPTSTYTLSFSAEDGGSVSSEGGTYTQGSKITVTATPDAQYLFKEWSDGSTTNPREITVTSNLTLKASFIKKTYPLAVTIEGEGTVQEEVIIQGSTSETEYNAGTTVRLTAIPNEGWVFAGWSGDVESEELEIEVPIEKGTAVSALFVKEYILFTNVLGEGEIIIQPIATNSDGSTRIKMKAIPKDGWKFDRWQNAIRYYEDELELNISSPIEIHASFLQDSEFVSVTKSYFDLDYAYGVRMTYNVGGGKKYFKIGDDEYFTLITDPFDSYLLKKVDEKWGVSDTFPSIVSGLPTNNYRGMGPIYTISENEFLVASNGEADTDPSTWGGYIYKGKIENDQLSYEKITEEKLYYMGSIAYEDFNGDQLKDILQVGFIFLQNPNQTFNQYAYTGPQLELYENYNFINSSRLNQIWPVVGMWAGDLFPSEKPEIILSSIDVSDKVDENEIAPRGDVLIFEYKENTSQYELAFEIPRRTIGEIESTENIQVHDINNDGIKDILLSITTGDQNRLQPLEVWLGNSDKTFSKHFEFGRQSFIGSDFKMLDINGDGYLDFVGVPGGDNAEWIKNWCLRCEEFEKQGLPYKNGLILQNSLWLNDGTGRFNVLNKELVIENSFVIWTEPILQNGDLKYIGGKENSIPGYIDEKIEIEIYEILISKDFFQ